MRKSSTKKSDDDELRSEYSPDFFRNLKPNLFANRMKLGRVHASPAQSSAKRVKKRGG